MDSIFKIIDYIVTYNALRTRKFWASYIGLLILAICGLLFIRFVFNNFFDLIITEYNYLKKYADYKVILDGIIMICVVYGWAKFSKRIFVRDHLLIEFGVIAISIVLSYGIGLFAQYFLIKWFSITLPAVGVIVFCGVGTLLLLLLCLYVETKCFRKHKILVCVAINNAAYPSVSAIENTLNVTLDKISAKYPNIEFICLPFDLYNNIKRYENYINRIWVQADSLIFADVINDERGGFSFTNFSSKLNTLRIKAHKENESLNQLLGIYEKAKDWNKINNEEKELTSRIKIKDSLYEMFLLYVSCVLLIKQDYIAATDMSREMYQIYSSQYGTLSELTNRLFSYALMMNALSAEHEHDYVMAQQRIDEYISYFPAMTKSVSYQMIMARMYYYLNNIPESKRCTQTFKAIDVWGYSLNMGFYAIIEGKAGEFIVNYKRMLTKKNIPSLRNITFAMRFLEYEKKTVANEKTKQLLEIAIALLYLYVDTRKARTKFPKYDNHLFSASEQKAIKWAETYLSGQKENLPIMQ